MMPTQAVKAVIRDEIGRVLLLQRNPATRGGESNWDLPGGLVEPAEDHEKALQRELVEELGCACTVGARQGAWSFIRTADNATVQVQNYAASLPADATIRLSDEHCAYAWVSAADHRRYPVKDVSLYDVLAPGRA